jgi:hypothetical protein
MRRSIIPALALATVAFTAMVVAQPAEASPRWFAGADFAVGGIHFSVGYFDNFGPGHPARHFYRTPYRLSHAGHRCTSACYIADGYYYHDRFCPVVRYHLGHHRYDPYPAWDRLDRGRYVIWSGARSHPGRGHYKHWRPDPRWSRPDYRWDRHDHRSDRRDHRWDRRVDRRDRREDRWDRRVDRRDRLGDRRDGRRDRGDRRGNGRSGRWGDRDHDSDSD